MIDSMTITTRWSKLLPDWRDADISETNVLDHFRLPTTCFMSASAWGIKGKMPGGKHSWIAQFDGNDWTTYEITDIETINTQNAKILYAEIDSYTQRQLIVSNRNPATMWFGNKPRVDTIHDYVQIQPEYPFNDNINLLFNNCNTYLSYVAWRHGFNVSLPYVGYKEKHFWDKMNEAG